SPKTGFSFEYSNPNRWLMMNLASEMTVNTTGNIRINRMANGIAIASIIFLELMMKKLLEKNSTVYRITTDNTKVSMTMGTSTVRLRSANAVSYHDSRSNVEKTPKTISEAMFPISVVPINHVGLRAKKRIIFPETESFSSPCRSVCFLFAERKETSMPEKNTEKKRPPITPARYALSIVTFASSNYK